MLLPLIDHKYKPNLVWSLAYPQRCLAISLYFFFSEQEATPAVSIEPTKIKSS